MDVFEILKTLTSAPGSSGAEGFAAQTALKLLKEYMPCEIDSMGNVVGRTAAQGNPILLDAHLDRIGMAVTAIDEKGFVKVARCGGVDTTVLTASEVTIHGKKDVYGVVTSVPPHLTKGEIKKAPEITDIAIDVMMQKDEAEKIISPGDRITIRGSLRKMLGSRVTGAALDDRSGILSILLCLEKLGKNLENIPVSVLFSACEETGGSGAVTGSYNSSADCAIAVDVSFAKAPGVPETVTADLGDGVLIGYSPSLNYSMSKKLEEIAKEKNISFGIEVMGGRTGTNADEISVTKSGIKTALLSIPLRNMHTQCEIIDMKDIEATADLMAEYILAWEAERNA